VAQLWHFFSNATKFDAAIIILPQLIYANHREKDMKRVRQNVAAETEKWLKAGTVNERWELGIDMEWCTARCVYYDEDAAKKLARSINLNGNHTTEFEFCAKTTLDAIWTEKGPSTALNFASCKKPGGGWRSGMQAQEESLARASGLVPTLESPQCADFYKDKSKHGWNAAGMILSPDVPVFREEDGTVREPKTCSFITCAAIDARTARLYYSEDDIAAEMLRRIEQILALAAASGATTLILGAWGTGVFANDVGTIASSFAYHLRGKYAHQFRRVVFAIPDKIDQFKLCYERESMIPAPELPDKHAWATTNAPRRKRH